MYVSSFKLILSLSLSVCLMACSSGGNVTTPQATPQTVPQTSAAQQRAMDVVVSMNNQFNRTPSQFYRLDRNSLVERDYMHVRSGDVFANSTIQYDLSSNDPYEAFLWAEQIAQQTHTNLSFDSSLESTWFYENTWSVNDAAGGEQHFLSVRVFKSSALDRSVYDANQPTALLAVMQQLPASDADVSFLSEYLWTYSLSNNVGHVVMSSETTRSNLDVRHTIREAVFNPAMPMDVCSSVQVWNLYHDVNNLDGGMTLSRSIQSEFQVRVDVSGFYVLCQDMPVETVTTEQGNLAVYPW